MMPAGRAMARSAPLLCPGPCQYDSVSCVSVLFAQTSSSVSLSRGSLVCLRFPLF